MVEIQKKVFCSMGSHKQFLETIVHVIEGHEVLHIEDIVEDTREHSLQYLRWQVRDFIANGGRYVKTRTLEDGTQVVTYEKIIGG